MTVSNELIDRLLADYKKQLTKRLVERALEAEIVEHEPVPNPSPRNGKSKKTLKGEFEELPIDIPRDRDGSFKAQFCLMRMVRHSLN